LAAVCGRTSDFLLAADGSKINGTALTTLLYDVRGIRRFQYRQASRERVTLEIAPLEHANQADLMKSLAVPAERLRHLLGGIQLDISFTDQILPSRSGKFRYIINEVTECKDKP
jgi:phenylacetate-CoA ligase